MRTAEFAAPAAHSRDRFTTEDDADLDRISPHFADHRLGRMQCNGDRCAALVNFVCAAPPLLSCQGIRANSTRRDFTVRPFLSKPARPGVLLPRCVTAWVKSDPKSEAQIQQIEKVS